MGIEENKQRSLYSMYITGLRHMRLHFRSRAWKQCQRIGIEEYFAIGLRGTGLRAYKRNVFTNSTEAAAVELVDAELWSGKIIEMLG